LPPLLPVDVSVRWCAVLARAVAPRTPHRHRHGTPAIGDDAKRAIRAAARSGLQLFL